MGEQKSQKEGVGITKKTRKKRESQGKKKKKNKPAYRGGGDCADRNEIAKGRDKNQQINGETNCEPMSLEARGPR